MQAFLPLLGTDLSLKGPKGRIINITSVGGKYGAPFMGAYAASKHAIEGMSDSLRRELMLYGVDVIVVGAFWLPLSCRLSMCTVQNQLCVWTQARRRVASRMQASS